MGGCTDFSYLKKGVIDLIEQGISQQERLVKLNNAAIRQMKVLAEETLQLTGARILNEV